MNTRFIDLLFELRGRAPRSFGPECPGDEHLAGFLDHVLSATERRGVENHLLACAACHELVRATLAVGERPVPAARTWAALVRVLDRGLQLAEAIGTRLLAGPPVAALGAVRGDDEQGELIAIEGPGQGLDRLELQLQANGQVRLAIAGEAPPARPGEITSVVLEVDGAPREKRPYRGEPLTFAPLDRGRYRLRILARAPGQQARELTAAAVELR